MARKSEFVIANAHQYNLSSPNRWILSHLTRYKSIIGGFILLALLSTLCYSLIPIVTGTAFTAVMQKQGGQIGQIALILLILAIAQGILELGAHYAAEILGKRLARDAREELYRNLLGKSQTFHNRQRIGDVMARAASDMTQLGNMISPACDALFIAFSSVLITLVFIGSIGLQLLLIPGLYLIAVLLALHFYTRQLTPVSTRLRAEFGSLNAVLNETVSGIELVKASAQEEQETEKFSRRVASYRDLYQENGKVQGRFLPGLFFGIALALALLHGLLLLSAQQLTLGNFIAFMGLMINLRTLISVSYWTLSLLQRGRAGTKRILALIQEETELDENREGHNAQITGEVIFEHVSFGYGKHLVLHDVSFHACAGQTIAIVGQIGAGKSSLAKLINRIYDVNEGQITIDGVDVRAWNLAVLRANIATIEQDIFLFSRSIMENITYGLGKNVDRSVIEAAAQDAQAHDFIQQFPAGYETEIGERGMTLSGGQRQRLAIARALLIDPRILILDDATSAIDSATEDDIQKAIKRVQQGRTTFLITHRLSQIRQADNVLLFERGRLIAQGAHDELMIHSAQYRRLFSHYETPATRAVTSTP